MSKGGLGWPGVEWEGVRRARGLKGSREEGRGGGVGGAGEVGGRELGGQGGEGAVSRGEVGGGWGGGNMDRGEQAFTASTVAILVG